jgi:hypothetical protein
MPLVQIKIENQLLIPFGAPKWSIERINVVGVSTTGTYIESDTPLAYINKAESKALRLRHFTDVMPGDWPEIYNCATAAQFIRDYLRDKCELVTDHERKFVDLYFEYCTDRTTVPAYVSKREPKDRGALYSGAPYNDDAWIFESLLPLPQAHLYQPNPLVDPFSFVPSRMMKVDFAFWTGKRLVAVEIDGGSHIGSEAHIEKDRLLQRAGVQVIHILNSEITKYGTKVIARLLPEELTHFWTFAEDEWRDNPLDPSPF